MCTSYGLTAARTVSGLQYRPANAPLVRIVLEGAAGTARGGHHAMVGG